MEIYSLLAVPCSKSTIKTLDQGASMFKVNNYDSRMTSMTAVIDVFRLFGRPVYWFGHPNSGIKKYFLSFIFPVVFRNIEVAISDVAMHLIILKWLRIQKC